MDLRFGKPDEQVTSIENGGLFSKEMCQRIARYHNHSFRKVMEMYDENKDGVIETITAGKMLMDLYRAMNKDFHPTATDIASYARIFDRTRKGKITYDDLEALSLKYFWNERGHP
jgi:Ca2+-binding EF-hand superfamily protein